MDISIHTGLGEHEAQGVQITQSFLFNCRVTRYFFRDYQGSQITINHYDHTYRTTEADDLGSDVILP